MELEVVSDGNDDESHFERLNYVTHGLKVGPDMVGLLKKRRVIPE